MKPNDPVFQATSEYLKEREIDGDWIIDKWYFWSETWSDEYGPYETEEEARKELKRYCVEVLSTPL